MTRKAYITTADAATILGVHQDTVKGQRFDSRRTETI